MDTTIIALRNLYVAMGGEAEDVANLSMIPDLINAIAELVASGATKELPTIRSIDEGKALMIKGSKWVANKIPTELPNVSEDDNGKVLKVIEGEWGVGTDN